MRSSRAGGVSDTEGGRVADTGGDSVAVSSGGSADTNGVSPGAAVAVRQPVMRQHGSTVGLCAHRGGDGSRSRVSATTATVESAATAHVTQQRPAVRRRVAQWRWPISSRRGGEALCSSTARCRTTGSQMARRILPVHLACSPTRCQHAAARRRAAVHPSHPLDTRALGGSPGGDGGDSAHDEQRQRSRAVLLGGAVQLGSPTAQV